MDLVDEEDGPFAEPAVVLGLFHNAADFLDAAGDGAEVDEGGFGAACDDAGEGCFAHAGRAPEDHGGDAVGVDELAQDLAFSEQVVLAGEFFQGARAHPAGERAVLGLPEKRFLQHGSSFFHERGKGT